MLYRKNHLSLIISLCFLTSFAACYAAEAPTKQKLLPPEDYANCQSNVEYIQNHTRLYVFEPWTNSNTLNSPPKALNRFSTAAWLEGNVDSVPNNRPKRYDMLSDLLNSYPLIGMSREAVYKLLGAPNARFQKITGSNIDSYPISSGFCGNAGSTSLEILYKDEQVSGYRKVHYKTLLYSVP